MPGLLGGHGRNMGSSERKLKILLVEDNPNDATWLEHMIDTSRAYPVELLSATTIRGAIERLESDPPHCVLLDLSLPDSDGVTSVRRLVEADPQTPIVVLTGAEDELGLDAVRSGAQDFLVKGEVSGDQILRHVLWAVARASVVAARSGGPRRAGIDGGPASLLEAAAVTVDAELRIVEANAAFEAMARTVGGLVGRPLTDLVAVDSLFDVYSALRPVASGAVDVVDLSFPLERGDGVEHRRATGLRLVADPVTTAVVLVVVEERAQA